jgi:magnesium chelatase family protein
MAVRAWGATLVGIDAQPIEVEVDLLTRLPSVSIVGLAAAAVREAAERVRSAIVASELQFPRKRIVINLAPADQRKDGAAFDLAIAMGILAGDGQLPSGHLDRYVFVGELALGGELRPVRGGLAAALLARDVGRALVLPRESAAAASRVPGVEVFAADSLLDVVAHVRGERPLAAPQGGAQGRRAPSLDLLDVRGQPRARRALEIAAAGAHHVWMSGPPGCGKSMLARRLPGILPSMRFEEALDVARVHAAARLFAEDGDLPCERPFRAPHHSVSPAGMFGDRSLRPGEASLAHHGVLFLDEAPEFGRAVLEGLRAPLEDRWVTLSRAEGSVQHPAALTLVLASNPCPCGLRGTARACRCNDAEVRRYLSKLSGPILDRVDLHVPLQAVPAGAWVGPADGEPSEVVRARVVAARARQAARGQPAPNGQLERGEIEAVAVLDDEGAQILSAAAERLHLSGRGTTRVLKVARTLADLGGSERVSPSHLLEALTWRAPEFAP